MLLRPLLHPPLDLVLGHILDMGRKRPFMAERIDQRARAVAVELVLDRPLLAGAGIDAR